MPHPLRTRSTLETPAGTFDLHARTRAWLWATLVVAILLVPVSAGLAAAVRPSPAAPGSTAPAAVGLYDPLRGDPALGVPRYNVTTAHLGSPHGQLYGPESPVWLAYDSADASFWVADLPNTVVVVPANQTWTASAVVAVGTDPFDVAVDNTTDEVFVTNTGSDNVSVISGATDLPIGSVGVGSQPTGIAYDSATNYVYVANQGSNTVTVFSASTLQVLTNISVGFGPLGVAFDPATGYIFVANYDSYTVSVIWGVDDAILATVPVGIDPTGVAVDNATDNVYVTNQGSSNISVILADTDYTVVLSIPVTTTDATVLQGIAYDSDTKQLWVGAGSEYLILINATAEQVAYIYSTDPAGVAWDPTAGTMCFTNTGNATFECYTNPQINTDTVTVTFTETGLPGSVWWNVTVVNGGPKQESNGSTIVFSVVEYYFDPWVAGAYPFYIPETDGYVAADPSPTVNISTSPVNVPVSFSQDPRNTRSASTKPVSRSATAGGSTSTTRSSSPTGGRSRSTNRTAPTPTLPRASRTTSVTAAAISTYSGGPAWFTVDYGVSTASVEFEQYGLPNGTAWYVNFTSGPQGFTLPSSGTVTGPYTIIGLENGSYTYTVATSNKAFVTLQNRTLDEYDGLPYAVAINFTGIPLNATFNEIGLPTSTDWTVNLGGTPGNANNSQIVIPVEAGVYAFTVGAINGYNATPWQGTLPVTEGGTNSVTITFASTWKFATTFRETGLPDGTGWSVSIAGQFESSLTSNVTLLEPNGTYGYVIQAVAGYTTTYSGTFSVAGSNQTIDVVFVAATYPIIIVEFGLPNGTAWTVTVSNASTGFSVTHGSNGSAILFYLPNGTYSISVSVPAGYSANLSSAIFTVAGTNSAAPKVHASPTGVTMPIGTTPLPASTIPPLYWVALGAMAAVIVMLVAFVVWSRQRPPPPGTPKT